MDSTVWAIFQNNYTFKYRNPAKRVEIIRYVYSGLTWLPSHAVTGM